MPAAMTSATPATPAPVAAPQPAASLAVSSAAQPATAQPGWMVRYGGVEDSAGHPQLDEPWQRPRQWLPLPELDPQDEKFVGLAAIIPGERTCLAIAAAGSFHVDWGDGTHQQVDSPIPAVDWWSYSIYRSQQASELQLPLLGTEPPWLNRQPESAVARYGGRSGPLPSSDYRFEVREDNRVWVVFDPPLWQGPAGYMLELRWRFTTAELVPTFVRHAYDYSNPALVGTETTRGYRQAIVTVTPQPGQRLTALRLQDGPAEPNSISSWLDVAIASPVLTDLWLGKRW